ARLHGGRRACPPRSKAVLWLSLRSPNEQELGGVLSQRLRCRARLGSSASPCPREELGLKQCGVCLRRIPFSEPKPLPRDGSCGPLPRPRNSDSTGVLVYSSTPKKRIERTSDSNVP